VARAKEVRDGRSKKPKTAAKVARKAESAAGGKVMENGGRMRTRDGRKESMERVKARRGMNGKAKHAIGPLEIVQAKVAKN